MIKKILKIVTIVLSVVCLSSFNSTFAASNLTLVSDVKTANIGQQFSVVLLLDAEENINAAQGIVSFSPSVIQMVSVDNSDSIFNFWVEDPTISNDVGTMSFVGGSSKSIIGKKLKILTMKFKTVGIGNSNIKLSNGVVTADDGVGTNVLSNIIETGVSVSGTVVTPEITSVVEQPKPIERAPVAVKKLPSAPKLSVPLYPEESKWYSQIGETSVFWDLPADVISVAVLVDKNPNGVPTIFEKQLFDGKNIGTFEEGVSYVHARFKNNVGNGPITTFKIAIDTTAPLDFKVQILEGLKIDNPSPTISFSTNDNLSGVAFYSVIVDAQAPIKTESRELVLPILEPGKHSVLVKAFDNAGNGTDASLSFEILPIASPEIKFVTQPFYSDSDNTLLVRGSGLSNSITLLSMVNSDGVVSARASTRANETGEWEYSFSDTFQNGKYKIVAVSQDDRGALSLPTEFVNVVVKAKPIFKIGAFELNLWGIIILLALLLIGSFISGYYFFKMKVSKIGRKIFITKQDVIKVTDMIKKDIENLKKAVKTADKFDDEFVIKELEENIEKIDKYIQKEIESIGK
ncbi:MAG: cohesin domain-containing protein [Minisyncoccota bacterium]